MLCADLNQIYGSLRVYPLVRFDRVGSQKMFVNWLRRLFLLLLVLHALIAISGEANSQQTIETKSLTISTNWHQGSPYKISVNTKKSPCKQDPAAEWLVWEKDLLPGCTNVAVAQLINYHLENNYKKDWYQCMLKGVVVYPRPWLQDKVVNNQVSLQGEPCEHVGYTLENGYSTLSPEKVRELLWNVGLGLDSIYKSDSTGVGYTSADCLRDETPSCDSFLKNPPDVPVNAEKLASLLADRFPFSSFATSRDESTLGQFGDDIKENIDRGNPVLVNMFGNNIKDNKVVGHTVLVYGYRKQIDGKKIKWSFRINWGWGDQNENSKWIDGGKPILSRSIYLWNRFDIIVTEPKTQTQHSFPCNSAKYIHEAPNKGGTPYFTPSAPPVFCYTGEFIVNKLDTQKTHGGTKLSGDVFVKGVSDAVIEVKDSHGNTIEEVVAIGKRPMPTSVTEIVIDNNRNLFNMTFDEYKCGIGLLTGKCDYRDASQSQKTTINIAVPTGGDAVLGRQGPASIKHNLLRWALEFIDMFLNVGKSTIAAKQKSELLMWAGKVVMQFGVQDMIQKRQVTKEDVTDWIGSLIAVLLNPNNIDGRTVFGKAIAKTTLKEITGMYGVPLKLAFMEAWIVELYSAYKELENPGPQLSLLTCEISENQANTDFSVSSSGSAGLATALVIDRSGSMKEVLSNPDGSKAKKLEKAKQAAKAFILAMNESDQISISTFSNGGSTEQPLISVQNARQTIDQSLTAIQASGGTNIGAGLEQGLTQLEASSGSQKTALLLSDGQNNQGDWNPAVEKYKSNGWPVCTIGFGKDADEKTLRYIAGQTGCAYSSAEAFDLVGKYQQLGSYVKGESTLVGTSELLAIDGKLIYEFVVNSSTKEHPPDYVTVHASWQGSTLSTVLIDPTGRRIDAAAVSAGAGRYVQGDTFQMLELQNPQPGKWKIEVTWADPPPIPEQVNILVTEKSDTFSQILSFRPQYSLGEGVTVNVEAKDLIGNRKVPMSAASITVDIQKPGEELIRMIQARSSNWTMYKNVVQHNTRSMELYDDGMHDDYKSGDGIFGNTFTETDKQGAYLVTALVNGRRQNGQTVDKILLASFQVGSILKNSVTTSQTLQYSELSKQQSQAESDSSYTRLIYDDQPGSEINDSQMQNSMDGTGMPLDAPSDNLDDLIYNQ